LKTKALAAGAALLLLALTGCSGSAAASSATPSASASPTASPDQPIVPRVIGESVDDAVAMLSAKNLKWEAIDWKGKPVQSPLGQGLVVTNSDPSELYPAKPGRPVTLVVATPAEASKPVELPSSTATPTPTPDPAYRPPSSDVVYTVTSDGPISQVTVGNTIRGKMGTEQFTEQPAKFTKSYHFDEDLNKQDFDFLSVNAQAGGGSTITCAISVNGQEVARQTSSGPYAVVMCSN
jgi:hypothetical protein